MRSVEISSPADLNDLQRWADPGTHALSEERAAGPSLTTRCFSDIESKPVDWLWPGRIARGKLTIIAGDPGLGKSQITASIAAIVSTGGLWPVDRDYCPVGGVLFMSAEDDPADTIRPRLEAAGADLRLIHFVDGVMARSEEQENEQSRLFSLETDVRMLDRKLEELSGISVLVIDPVSAYFGNADSHKNTVVRAVLAPLADLAARHNIAIIAISHLSKDDKKSALMRVSGSLAFAAAARSAWVIVRDSERRNRRLFLPLKNNLAADSTGLAFQIEGATVETDSAPIQTSRLMWESDPVTTTADEAIRAASPQKPKPKLEEAKNWLTGFLDNRSVSADDVVRAAKEAGIAQKTLERAADVLKVKKNKLGMDRGWTWSLSDEESQVAIENALDD